MVRAFEFVHSSDWLMLMTVQIHVKLAFQKMQKMKTNSTECKLEDV